MNGTLVFLLLGCALCACASDCTIECFRSAGACAKKRAVDNDCLNTTLQCLEDCTADRVLQAQEGSSQAKEADSNTPGKVSHRRKRQTLLSRLTPMFIKYLSDDLDNQLDLQGEGVQSNWPAYNAMETDSSQQPISIVERGSWNKKQPINVEERGSWNKRQPIEIGERGSWNKRQPIEIGERGSWNKRDPISIDERGSWNKRDPISIDERGSWNKRDPISVDERGSWNKRDPISIDERGSWNKRDPINVDERGSWNKRQLVRRGSWNKRGSWN